MAKWDNLIILNRSFIRSEHSHRIRHSHRTRKCREAGFTLLEFSAGQYVMLRHQPTVETTSCLVSMEQTTFKNKMNHIIWSQRESKTQACRAFSNQALAVRRPGVPTLQILQTWAEPLNPPTRVGFSIERPRQPQDPAWEMRRQTPTLVPIERSVASSTTR